MTTLADMTGLINSGLWAWTYGDAGTLLIQAKDQEEAYRKAIACRIEDGASLEDAEAWFEHNDTLVEIEGTCDTKPYEGDIAE